MESQIMIDPWFVRPAPRPSAKLQLFCFSHAGGAASAYHSWGAALDNVDVWAIQLPGREGRMHEPLVSDLNHLQETIADVITPCIKPPYVFFGHSMGAVVAYETARKLQRRGTSLPIHLYVSGRAAPSLPNLQPPLHPLTDEDFIAELDRRFGGLPAAILAEPALLALFLPILRADLKMLEQHDFDDQLCLDIPISAYAGNDDLQLSTTDLEAWGELTSRLCTTRRFPGGHFYPQQQRDVFLRFLANDLNERLMHNRESD